MIYNHFKSAAKHLAWGLVIAFGTLSPCLFADINPAGRNKSPALSAPPSPVAKVARVVRGKVTELELKVTSGSLARVLFVIREQPAHGTLEGPFPINGQPTRALIRYISNPNSAVEADSFSFAAQLRGGPLSKMAKVNLILADAVAELEFAPEVAFSEVRVGRQVAKRVRIKNVGNAPFFSELRLEAPWSIPPEAATLSLKEGESAEIPILFLPSKVGQQKSELVLDAELGLHVRLSGAGSPVFTADPSRVDFLNGEGSERITVNSHSPFDEEITIITEGQMVAPDRLMLPAGGEVSFELSLPEGSGAGFRGVLHLRQHQQKTEIAVASGGSPAEVTFVEVDKPHVNIGTRSRGAPLSHTLKFNNKGGLPAFLTVDIEPPFWIPEASEGLKVEAGETREVSIEVDTSAPGSYSSPLLAEYEGGALQVKLIALVLPDRKQPIQRPEVSDWVYQPTEGGTILTEQALSDDKKSVTAMSEEEQRYHAMEAIQGSTMLRRRESDLVPGVQEVRLKQAGQSKLQINWNRPPAGAVNGYIIEFSEVVYDQEKRLLRNRWIPQVGNIEIAEDGPLEFLATITGLRPNSITKMRVTAVGADELSSTPSPEYEFRTLQPEDRSYIYWLGLLLLLVLLVGWFLMRKRMMAAD